MENIEWNTDRNISSSPKHNVEGIKMLKNRFANQDNSLIPRHIGPTDQELKEMLSTIGIDSLEQLCKSTVPTSIYNDAPLGIGQSLKEDEALKYLKNIANKNKVYRSYIGMGYHNCVTPTVIQRNILENPGWYTQYTPYQAEISQGRLEALLNFQTMVKDLSGMEIANASLLDEGTAAAEAMAMAKAIKGRSKNKFFVSELCHPQTIEVLQTRAEPIDVEIVIGNHEDFDFNNEFFGALVQYPATNGEVFDYSAFAQTVHDNNALLTVAADILSLCLLKSPGAMGADIAIGNTQRFGLGLFYGGPHAAYLATKDQYKRQLAGRIIGVSKDKFGKPAARLALQTREQHIRRDKATSNICTSQVLLAVTASMYAVYHGPEGLKRIATRVHELTSLLHAALNQLGFSTTNHFFDCISVTVSNADEIIETALSEKINLRKLDQFTVSINLDEATTIEELALLVDIFADGKTINLEDLSNNLKWNIPKSLVRTEDFMTHENFHKYHSESDFLRYVFRLQSKDLSLAHSMIPLGSCTMKLNATSEMLAISWPEFSNIHPFAPKDQAMGYQELFAELESMLCKATGFDAMSLQPNAGSQGEYAGLLAIRAYHNDMGQTHRNICLIPTSAHGTNPASAVMAGMKVIPVNCDNNGNIDVEHLKQKAEEHKDNLSSLMITYPSTHGVFEESIKEICEIIHANGGQVYLDGANMNAQVGLCQPGKFGADVCHLNLHKTFAIPHGGGGPGVGPIGVKEHLAPYLPGNKTFNMGPEKSLGAISAAPWGSAIILNISWAYIKMMGDEGLRKATEVSILNANYIAKRLQNHFPVLYKGNNGLVAHECIIDTRPLQNDAHISVADIAKRLMDYGFHAPTMSWPVTGTLMIEPTESESKAELDRFCDAMISIHQEITDIISGKYPADNNPLVNAPHTAEIIVRDEWNYSYSRELAAYPLSYLRTQKFWPSVSRIDDAFGDKNLFCTCPDMSEFE